jgi:hypothetical protein
MFRRFNSNECFQGRQKNRLQSKIHFSQKKCAAQQNYRDTGIETGKRAVTLVPFSFD